MSRFLFTASLLASLLLLPVEVAAQPEAIAGEVYFDPAQRQLYLPWHEGVPVISELKGPHRLLVELPWTGRMAEGTREFKDEWVKAVRVQRQGLTARVELRLAKPLNGDWHPAAARGLFSLRIGQPVATVAQLAVKPSPSAKPMASPRSKPSAGPSVKPTAKPSVKPSASPSVKPSAKPIVKPSASPSLKPSAKPSVKPSAKPSVKPSAKPSVKPSAKPSVKPTAKPSVKPSASPSLKPSASPSLKPSAKPSVKPSASPSLKPSASASVRPAGASNAQGVVGRFTYDEEVRYFLLPVTQKVTPIFRELTDPPRLVIDLPGSKVGAPQRRSYPGALVREATLETTPEGGAQAVLFLARPITKQWKWKQSGSNLVVVFDHRPAAATRSGTAPAPSPMGSVRSTPSSPAPAAVTPMSIPKPAATLPVPAKTARPRTGHAFSGTVYNINSGEPLAGVRVTIGSLAAVSDKDGRFEVLGLATGAHTVSVAADGFSRQTFTILVPDDKSISLNLVPSLQ